MNVIKFSHEYFKMPAAYDESSLAQVIILNDSELSQQFKEYDTAYKDYDSQGYALPVAHYPLPKGKIILLLLIANKGRGWLWCTIRRWTPEKEKYYKSIQGQDVRIEVI